MSYLPSPFPLLSLIIWLPLVGAAGLYLLPDRPAVSRTVAGVVSLVVLGLTGVVLWHFDGTDPGLQFVEAREWIPAFGVGYVVGIDGLSVVLLLLTAALVPLVVVASASVGQNVRGYLAAMLVLETAMLGTLAALDIFLFYVFWELMLAPMYFIIGVWGGARRAYASMKFVLYTVAGSVLMFLAIFYVVWAHARQGGGAPSFLLEDLMSTRLSVTEQTWLFAAFAVAFGVKVPVFPFHTWLPDAHVEAPTGGSVILAGVLLKMGIYGFLRIAYPLFPVGAEVFAPYLAVLAVTGIVYGACVAWVQPDMKKLVAYSSVSHLGYCVLGLVALTPVSTTGSIFQMVSHGVTTGALFLLVGVLYDRTHSREIADYSGLARTTPVFAFLFLVTTFGSIALPLTSGFVGEFLILSGSFPVFPVATAVALAGVVLGAVYMLTLYMRTVFGPVGGAFPDVRDVTSRELVTLAPLVVSTVVLGVYPQPVLRLMQPSVSKLVAVVKERAAEGRTAEGNARSSAGGVAPGEARSGKGGYLVRGIGFVPGIDRPGGVPDGAVGAGPVCLDG